MDPEGLRRHSRGADVDLKNGDDPRRVPLDLILAATSDLIFVFDREGRYLYANPLGARAFGLDIEKIIGKTWRELGRPAELMLECDRQRETVFRSGREYHGTTSRDTTEGFREYDFVLSPVATSDEVNAVVATLHDVTGQRAFERQRNEVIGIISHELRTPLTVIKGQAQYLARYLNRGKPAEPRDVLPRLKSIDDTASRMARMVDDLVQAARGAVKPQTALGAIALSHPDRSTTNATKRAS
jgi:PAS domain S-box-containing protein